LLELLAGGGAYGLRRLSVVDGSFDKRERLSILTANNDRHLAFVARRLDP